MRRNLMFMVVGAVLVPALAGCGGGPDVDDAPDASGPSPTSTADPSSPATSTPTPTGLPSAAGDVGCLVSGSPWQVSLNDLESQFPAVMSGINVTSVRIAGGQTLTVDGDLNATFTDNTTTTIKVDMTGGLTMVMVQKHRGSASGSWEALDGKLVSDGAWTGGIRGTTTVTINGRRVDAPFEVPSGGLGDLPTTYSCADGTLNLAVEGSPFAYLLT